MRRFQVGPASPHECPGCFMAGQNPEINFTLQVRLQCAPPPKGQGPRIINLCVSLNLGASNTDQTLKLLAEMKWLKAGNMCLQCAIINSFNRHNSKCCHPYFNSDDGTPGFRWKSGNGIWELVRLTISLRHPRSFLAEVRATTLSAGKGLRLNC